MTAPVLTPEQQQEAHDAAAAAYKEWQKDLARRPRVSEPHTGMIEAAYASGWRDAAEACVIACENERDQGREPGEYSEGESYAADRCADACRKVESVRKK